MKLIFICGAPRSGTSLLTDLLRGHPELIVFPGESRIATYWYRCKNKEERIRFFGRDYLNTFEVNNLCDFATQQDHINYIKKDCHSWNLITVCISCHAITNHNRKYWQEFYQNIMIEKYGYDYKQVEAV